MPLRKVVRLARPGLALVLMLGLFAAASAGLLWLQAERAQAQLQQQTLLRAEQRAQQLADAVSGQAIALFGSLDVALLQLRREWMLSGDAKGRSAEAFDAEVRVLLAALPAGSISHVSVFDAEGRGLYNSLAPQDRISVADREHFRVHQGGQDRLYVGKAVQARLAQGRWGFVVNRPLLRAGAFAGTINIIVPTDYVATKLAALQLDRDDVVALVHDDGSFIARSREHQRAMGVQLPGARPFLSDRAASQGHYRQPGGLDGVQRLYAWQRLPGQPLVAVVGLGEQSAMAPLAAGLERERLIFGLLLTVVLAAAVSIGVLLWQAGQRQRALQRGETRYRALVDSAPEAIFVTRDGRFAYLNPAALQLFGADTPARLLGRPVLEHVHPDDHALVLARRRTLAQGLSVPAQPERYLRLNGELLDVEVSAAPYADDDGVGTQVVVRDIGERLRAARALAELAQELEQRVEERTAALASARDEAERANRAKSEFLSRMSHELRTPLNAVLGFGQLLEHDLADAGQRAKVAQILAAGQHLLALINDVLDLARVEAGHLAVSTEPVAVQALVADCLTLMRPQVLARGLSLSAPAADDRRQVRADRTRLKQVLLNLLSNAVKYNRRGGSVAVRIEDSGDCWRLRVDDSGPGLDAAQQARLFVPFERLDAGKSAVEGTGIGLALSRRLVELMHGSIGVHSEPGRGSTFWVDLRKADDAVPLPAPVPPPEALLPPGAAADGRAPLLLLCIEDNPANLTLVEHVVALRPRWQLQGAATPSQGLALARAQRPRLVLLDLHLPEMDGWAVLRVLREDPRLRGLPVVAVSAHAMPADLERGKAAGFDDYLTKPIAVPRLLALLDAHAEADAGAGAAAD